MNSLGIYIHIPFCVKKCSYCDFYSLRHTTYEREKSYIEALCTHIKQESNLYKDYTVDTIFLGGGTPSILSLESIKELTACLKNSFNITKDAEFTIEANPGTLDREKLNCYLENGINRLSIGLQSTNDNELLRLGRIHTFEDFEKSYQLARECGFKNISIDVMLALPDQNLEGFMKTLDRVCDFNPEHISSYCLKIEDNTFFGAIREKLVLPSEEEENKMYIALCKALKERGYEQYEVSNFSKKGYRSRHNLKYWQSEEYIGFGPSAHSYFNGVRYSYPRDINKYINDINNGCLKKTIEDEGKSEEDGKALIDKMDEYVMLKLRITDGISNSEFENQFGTSFLTAYPRVLKYIRSGHMKEENGCYSFTPTGFIVSNYILVDILHF